jgi:hypothetical protein
MKGMDPQSMRILERRQSEEGKIYQRKDKVKKVNFREKMKCGDECLWYTSDHEIELIQ